MAVTYPEGDGVAYHYDKIGNIVSVRPATVTPSKVYYTVNTEGERVGYEYDDSNRLSKIETESTVYSFSYDAFGKTLGISVGNGNLVNYTYHEYNGKIDTMIYANGKTIKYFYDDLDKIEKICYIENVSTYVDICRYTYDTADG